MLDEWLSPMSVSLFARDYLRKQPFASPSSARTAIPVFGWGTLEGLLTNDPAADLLVIARGKLVDLPAPKTLTEVRALLLEGIGLVIRRAEQVDAGLARLPASLTQHIPGEVHVQLFVTPAGTIVSDGTMMTKMFSSSRPKAQKIIFFGITPSRLIAR
jgi:hypothetical protein